MEASFYRMLLIQSFMVLLASSSSTNNTDNTALLAFKAQIKLNNPDNVLANNWTSTASLCNWIGVSCNLGRQRVTALNLSHMALQGTISPLLSNLSFLSVLDLSFNNFHGHLPDDLGHLRRLRLIVMYGNQLEGQIPQSLSQCKEVEKISMSYNQLGGELPSWLGNLPKLRILYLGANKFIGSIPSSMGNISSLEELDLAENLLHGDIPKQFGNLSRLEILFAGYNHLHGDIPEGLARLSKIKMLVLDMNNLTGEVPQSIFNLSSLQVISCTANQLSGYLPMGIGLQLHNLEGLYLGGNKLRGKIPHSICNASKLTALDLDGNNFSGQIPVSLGNLPFLQLLNLHSNHLTNAPGTLELQFLISLEKCRFLEKVWIFSNPLNGVLPKSIGNLSTSLQIFHASSCLIKGGIPGRIGNLRNLIELRLADNDLNEIIPSSIGQLEKLQRLSLDGNNIKGSIPHKLCHLTQLGELFLHENHISGSIPNCIGNLSQLQKFSLASNTLTGEIPLSFWRLKSILFLNFSRNYLRGHLPSELGSLKILDTIDLSQNRFLGEIPSIIGDLQMLSHLNLSRNSFEGSIPQSFYKLINLESMDLSSNALNGTIPKSLQNLSHLGYLNLSFNNLQGEIPSRGAFANLTAQSFMGNIELCGARRLEVPPCDVHTLPNPRQLLLLRYILPTIASILVLVAFIILLIIYRTKKENISSTANLPLHTAHRTLSHRELVLATNNFSEENLLGVGNFSFVYKGILSDGTLIAVKVLDLQLEEASKSFDAECLVLRNVRHRNLVKVISTCSNLDFKALVLQFMSGGSLEKWLYSHNYCLDLVERINIMIDVALGLEYLHHGCSEPVVHCDLKPSNILLDEDMVAHVSDFGIAKILAQNKPTTQTKTLGTIGYIAPEYGSDGRVSTRGDVYSYGIILMETFTRKNPTDEMFGGLSSLRQWVDMSFPHSIRGVMDANLLKEEGLAITQSCVSAILELALRCSRESPEERSNMKEVVVKLRKIKSFLSM